MTTYSPGDRVVVEPRTALLGWPAPGGPGVVTAAIDTSFGEVLEVSLDDGERRHPSASIVAKEA